MKLKIDSGTIRTWRAIGSIFVGGISFGILIGQMSEQYKNRVLRSRMDVLEENLEIKKKEADVNYQVMRARIHDLHFESIFENKMLMHIASARGWGEDTEDLKGVLERLKYVEKELRNRVTDFDEKSYDLWSTDIHGHKIRESLWNEH